MNEYCYLSSVIDNEMSMFHEFKYVYHKVEQKVYTVGKLRYVIDERSSVLIYNQAI